MYMHGAQRNVLVITMYRPGSEEVSSGFFREFYDVLERKTMHILLSGDHPRWCQPSFGWCKQSIHGSFQRDSWTVLSRSTFTFDHSPSWSHSWCRHHQTGTFCPSSACGAAGVIWSCIHCRRHWFESRDWSAEKRRSSSSMAKDRFRCSIREDLHQSSLPIDPPSGVAELFACYDETLKYLVDKHAPYADVKLHTHLNAPWYDSRCQIEKLKTRRLEHVYRRKKCEESFKAWRSQSQYLQFVLREQYTEYWSRTLSSNMN